ncbi:MAG: DUF423 domain-containing protein [Fimbriimonadales bacterium]|nr:DUF423 domain-containing protein [Fimbriimonadales bacterium]
MDRRWFAVGCLMAALAVGLGAFGAHGLRPHLDDRGLELYRTAIQYLMLHSLGVIVAGMVRVRSSALAASLFALGSLLFGGSLIALALGGPRWMGIVAPLGGISFVFGWILLAVGAFVGKP